MTRMMLERGHNISVGMKWSRGGGDKLAERLGVKRGREWQRVFGDGDFDALDQNIHYIFIQLFYWMGGVYFKKDHKDYEIMMRIIKFLAQTVSARLVRFFQHLVAVVVGKMPSGCWMTSHGDSWIVLLWFFIFGIMQILKAPLHKRAYLENCLVVRIIILIVYGDDHILSNDRDETAELFSEEQFMHWCTTYLKVTIRDARSDVPFCVQTRNGYKTSPGIVYLKHFMVRNREVSHGQSYYLPFRDMCDYQIKCVWGKECKDRDIYDFLLSTLGHAYGTYASNYDAYSWLRHAHVAAIDTLGAGKYVESLGEAMDRGHTNSDFMKKMRQADISMQEIFGGYPTWETLVAKNTYDSAYHEHLREDPIEYFR